MKKPYRYNELSDVQCSKREANGIQCQRMIKQNLVYKKSQQDKRPGRLYCYEHYKMGKEQSIGKAN